MATLILLTAEPDNEVPKRLKASAEKLKLETEIINPLNCYISLSTDDTYISHEGTKFMGAEFCIPRLSEDSLEYKVAIMDHLEKMGVKMLNSGSAMRNCSNKILTQILLTKADIETPKTVVVTNDEQLEFAVKAIGDKFPVIVKTLFGTHGVGVIRADSFPSLKSIVQQLLKSEVEFMIQEFIEHKESARIYILGDDVLAAVMRTIPDGDFRSNAHQGADLKVHKPEDKEKEVCLKASKTVGANFSAVDYIIGKDGEVIVIEVNGSPGFEAIQKEVDFDMAERVVKWLTKHEDEMVPEVEEEEEEEASESEPNEPEQVDTTEAPKKEDAKEEDKDEKSDHKVIDMTTQHDETDIIGTITNILIKYINDDKPIEARVDTGASHSSLNADDIEHMENTVKFRFGSYIYKFPLFRMVKIKTSDNDTAEERPVIRVDMVINGISVNNVELTLNDRNHMNFNVLLGRSTLAAAGVLIDPSARNLDNEDEKSEKKIEKEPAKTDADKPKEKEEE